MFIAYFPLLRRIAACIVLLCTAGLACAHDIPGKATLLVYVKPEQTPTGPRLLVLVRAPLEALSEVQFPVRGPGFLDLPRAAESLRDAARIYVADALQFYADGAPLGVGQVMDARAALPSDKSFVEFDSALANFKAAQVNEDIYWKQALLDAAIAFPVAANVDIARARFSLDADLKRIAMQTHTVLRFVPLQGEERVFDYLGDPGRIELEPGRWHAFSQFVRLGFWHILDGADHLLFLFCLLIPTRKVRSLVAIVTAFTLAHSITLISSALNLVPTALWFPPLIETLIAASVVYMGCENIFGARLHIRWVIVFCFGLVHGFGFSFILADRMQFAGAHLLSALLAFNVGVEIGQLFVIIVTVPLLRFAFGWFARVANGERIGIVLLSALAAHSAWHWLLERGERLLQYSWSWPVIDASFIAATLRWVMLLMACGGVMWAVRELLAHFQKSNDALVANRVMTE